jgi:hypothetical protein
MVRCPAWWWFVLNTDGGLRTLYQLADEDVRAPIPR